MTITVSISELRNNISSYLDKVSDGAKVIVRDDKRDIEVAQVTSTKSFDKKAYERSMKAAAGVFTEENHPEWCDAEGINRWLVNSRTSDEREFK